MLRQFYDRLLTILRQPVVRDGQWQLLECTPPGTATGRTIASWHFAWQGPEGERFVVAVNYAPNQSQCRVRLPFADLGGKSWQLQDQLSSASYEWDGNELQAQGLFVDLRPGRPRSLRCPETRTIATMWMSERDADANLTVPSPPRVVAISGIIFSALYIVSLVLIRLAVPADPTEPGFWLADPAFRNWVRIALNLVPFTGIAFLWFMAVLRNRIGLLEDRFFATVFLGSGLLFVAMLFAAVSVARGPAGYLRGRPS